MAIKRQGNFLSQQRIDVPDLRSIESGVANDFDALAGKMLAGKQPIVVRGLTVSTANTRGNPADQLQLSSAGAIVLHYGASESGTVFTVPDTASSDTLSATNSRVTGSFTAGIVNYVGIDLKRTADTSTVDSTKFLDADTSLETGATVPKARTLDFTIIISTQPFSVTSNVCPVAKVLTDSSNNVVSVTDARKMMFRLGAGGDNPDASIGYNFTDSDRAENPITFSVSSPIDPFAGGDKEIRSMKEWMDAVMTMIWEVKSGPFWYSPTARDNIKMIFTASVLTTNGDNFDYIGGVLTWKGIKIAFENSPVSYNIVQDDTSGQTFSDGDCLYVDIQRDTTATVIPVVAPLVSLGTPTQPGSRFILAWCVGSQTFIRDKGYQVGRAAIIATTSILGIVKLSVTPTSSVSPTVVSVGTDGAGANTATGAGFGLIGYGSLTTGSKGILGVAGGSTGTIGDYSSAASSNNGVLGVGRGAFAGVSGFGGGTSGAGVSGVGGGTAGPGVIGSGASLGTSYGVYGIGGAAGGSGVYGIGTFAGTSGIIGQGVTSGYGVEGHGGATDGAPGVVGVAGGTTGSLGSLTPSSSGTVGVLGVGRETGAGVEGHGGTSTGAPGIYGAGGGSGSLGTVTTGGSNVGVFGVGRGTGAGVVGNGGASDGTGGYFTGGVTNGIGVAGTGRGSAVGGDFSGHGTGTATADDAINVNQNIRLGGSNPLAATAFTNRITPKNVIKASGCWTCDLSNGQLLDGFNMSAPTTTPIGLPSDTKVQFTFATAMANANYSLVWNTRLNGPYNITGPGTSGIAGHPHPQVGILNKTTTGFQVSLIPGVSLNFDDGGGNFQFDFQVVGAQ